MRKLSKIELDSLKDDDCPNCKGKSHFKALKALNQRLDAVLRKNGDNSRAGHLNAKEAMPSKLSPNDLTHKEQSC